jgi:phosphomannomutase
MFTASHNPAQYNGIKMCRAYAVPVGMQTGLAEIRDLVAAGERTVAPRRGTVSESDVLADYAAHLLTLAPVHGRRLTVVVDAGNGMAGHTAPAVFEKLDVDLVPMYFELDGSFPNHEANPIEPENLRDLQARVRETGADIGLAFDGDADRCFLVDERGELVSPSVLTALIAARELAKEPGSTVIHNLITSRAVPEIITERGGTPVRTRVGHSFIKATMAESGAVFGGEHSGHFYFRDFWRRPARCAPRWPPHGTPPLSGIRFPATPPPARSTPTVTKPGWAGSAEYGGVDVTVDHLDGLTAPTPLVVQRARVEHRAMLRRRAEGKDGRR